MQNGKRGQFRPNNAIIVRICKMKESYQNVSLLLVLLSLPCFAKGINHSLSEIEEHKWLPMDLSSLDLRMVIGKMYRGTPGVVPGTKTSKYPVPIRSVPGTTRVEAQCHLK